MAASSGLHLSTVVMHHPSRADRLPRLLDALAGLAPRVVTDPDPDGPPSPLRTAKRAWAAIAPGATHHIVIQDDVRPVSGFAELLRRAVAARPHQGVSLYVNWNSSQNSYRVRQAAAWGRPFAELSTLEYTPTLGLALPVAAAAGLAAHLAGLPDHLRDDDEMVTPFRRAYGLDVVATVPNLLDHGGDLSLAGNGGHGIRHAVVFHPDPALAHDHWTHPCPPDAAAGPGPLDYAVEMADSACRIRPVRPLAVEPVEHPFGWPWHDWCTLIGADRERIAETWRLSGRREPRADLALEFWAACYLLGADVRRHRPGTGRPAPHLRAALDSWIASGLSAADRAHLSAADRETLRELGLDAFDRGRTDAGFGPHTPAAEPALPGTPLEATCG
ncbi:hypothetical protein ACIQAC_35140 [Streptomyces sp. NPDC088387]|uniref:hypothetical protein n=1 Tax=Streptomyces sp. NPDC088387 TaxID=3365859 RepID=UPI00382E090F